jgi:hypothetical protein
VPLICLASAAEAHCGGGGSGTCLGWAPDGEADRSVENCPTCDCTREVVTAERVLDGVQQVAEHRQAQEELTHARQERDRLHSDAVAARRKVSRLERRFRADSKFTGDPGVG